MSNTTTNTLPNTKARPPVELHEVPDWLESKLSKTLGWKNYGGDGYSLCRDVASRWCRSLRWFQHCGTAVVDGQPVFVCEPGLKRTDDFSDAEEFAELLDCELVIDEQSNWHPSQALRLTFVPTGAA